MSTKALMDWPYIINLGNSIIGVSVLAMPFCFKQCGVLLGVLLLLGSAVLTNISCGLLMKAASVSKKRSYEFLAFHAFGGAGKLVVELGIIGLMIGTCIAFYVIIGDLGPAILSKILGVENTPSLRMYLMVFLGICIALPLGLLRDLDSLSNISAVSLGFYAVFIAEVFTAALPNLWSGVWVTKVEIWNPEGVFKCLPIYSLSYGCQTQLFVMYDALAEPSLKRMTSITKNAIQMCTVVYLLVGYFGYVAFCDEDISGDVLMNFRPTIFSEAVKLGFVLSVAVSFPLVIFPLRASLYTLLFSPRQGSHESIGGITYIPEFHFKAITVCIVIGSLIVGILVPNVEFVLAITGATMGSLICFIFPAILFITLTSVSKSTGKPAAQLVLFLGVTILLASTYTTLYNKDKVRSEESIVKIAVPDTPDLNVPDLPRKPVEDVIVPDIKPPDENLVNLEVLAEKKEDEETADVSDEKRQEPPNPHAPLDVEEKVKDQMEQNEELKEILQEQKEEDEARAKKQEEKEVAKKQEERGKDDKEENLPSDGKAKAVINENEELKEILQEQKEADEARAKKKKVPTATLR